MENQQIPEEYAWIKPGVKVRHVMMSTDNMWVASGLPTYTDGEWVTGIRGLSITMPCDVLMSEDSPPIYDSQQSFPEPDGEGPFYVSEREDGVWECGHSGSGNTVYGRTERESLKRMLMQYEEVLTRVYGRWIADDKRMKKARAVLAEHRDIVEATRFFTKKQPASVLDKAILALADALEGGGE